MALVYLEARLAFSDFRTLAGSSRDIHEPRSWTASGGP